MNTVTINKAGLTEHVGSDKGCFIAKCSYSATLNRVMKTFHKTENFYHSFQPSCRMNYAEKRIIKNYNLVIGRGRCMHFLRQK